MSEQKADREREARIRERRGPTLLKRNALIVDEKGFKGEWVAIPREDFDYTKARVERYREALEKIAEETGTPYGRIAHRALNDGEDDGEPA